MGSTGKGMELFQSDMSLVMTDVEGSTALWEWNSCIMNIALGMHDHTLRAVMPQFFGYEVWPMLLLSGCLLASQPVCCTAEPQLLLPQLLHRQLAACKKAKLITVRATQPQTAFHAP